MKTNVLQIESYKLQVFKNPLTRLSNLQLSTSNLQPLLC
jgi:hypothetical protein